MRILRRKSQLNFLFAFTFAWFLILTVFLTWSNNSNSNKFDDVQVKKVVKSRLGIESEAQPVFPDFEDDFAEMPEKKRKITKPKAKEGKLSTLDPPRQSQEILNLHRLLNLTNPGHLGKPVVLPSNLSLEIQEKIKLSWENYAINEFVSNLIPLYRELPDIRPEYCRSVEYSRNLPVTSVIMIFHNEV